MKESPSGVLCIAKAWLAVGVALAIVSAASAATQALWTFDQGVDGTPFSDLPVVDESGNGNLMYGYDAYWGPSYSSQTAMGYGLSSMHEGHNDGYTTGAPINAWSPSVWTIETTVKLDVVDGWKTFMGRDGSSQAEPESDFYLQNNGIDNRFRVNFDTVGGTRYVLDSDFVAVAGMWYGIAVVSDGSTITMYADKQDGLGLGYQVVGTLAMVGATIADNALAASDFNWTFGRGWYNGGFVDHITGNLDSIRFSDTALAPDQFLQVPEPSALALAGLSGLALLLRRRVKR